MHASQNFSSRTMFGSLPFISIQIKSRLRIVLPLIHVLFVCVFFGAANLTKAQIAWTQSPGPVGGQITSIITSGTTLFASTTAGVYRSTDNGDHWIAVNDGLNNRYILSLVLDSTTIYAGANGAAYKSVDNGESWTDISGSGFPADQIRSFAVSGTTLVVGTLSNGVFVSSDGGQNWSAASTQPSNPTIMSLLASGGKVYASTNGGGVFTSSDNGVTWADANSGLTGSEAKGLLSVGSSVYVCIWGHGVYQTSNGGQSWLLLADGVNPYCISLAYDGASTLYAGTGGNINKSTDGGQTWAAMSTGFAGNPPITSMVFNGTSFFFGGAGGGIYRTTDGGQNWNFSSSGIVNTEVWDVVSQGSYVYAGAFGAGVARSMDSGQTWAPVKTGLYVQALAIGSTGTLYAGTYGGGIWRSTDYGDNWTLWSGNLLPFTANGRLAIKGNTFFACTGGDGIWRSTDGGQTWAASNAGLTEPFVSDVTVSGNYVFAGTTNGIFVSSDNGANWVSASSGLVSRNIHTIAASSGIALAGTDDGIYSSVDNGQNWAQANTGLINTYINRISFNGSNIYAATADGVYLSLDNAQQWTLLDNSGLPGSTFIRSASADATKVYAGTIGWGVFTKPLSRPSVSITTPVNNTSYSGIPANIAISAEANDPEGLISQVDFYAGGTHIASATQAPYEVIWRGVDEGIYGITAVATNNTSISTTSAPVNVMTSTSNPAKPSVYIFSYDLFASEAGPTPGSFHLATTSDRSLSARYILTGTATNGVDYELDTGTILFKPGQDVKAVPIRPIDDNVPEGLETVTLTIKSSTGYNSSSRSATMRIIDNDYNSAPPSVTFTNPTQGSSVEAGSNVNISVNASDPDGQVVKVEYFREDILGSTKIGESTTAPFNFILNNISPGNYKIRAIATDNSNDTVVSAPLQYDATGDFFSSARLKPENRVGGGGVDLLSRNFNWRLPLVQLEGRSALDLGLSLSYNSLVWTTSNNEIGFDIDHGYPGPGFRLGFPVIQNSFTTATPLGESYMLITPSGSRTELRRVGQTNTYESVDSSYLRLSNLGGGVLRLQTSNGTQMTFMLTGSEYHCTKVKDRNGNYMTAVYDQAGRITKIIDTLNREITFNYNTDTTLASITQNWGGQTTHTWASFEYAPVTINTNFSSLVQIGPPNSSSISALKKVILADNSSYVFDYTSFGQVNKITHKAADDHTLAYTSYTQISDGSDCPRVTERKDWVENWNDESGSPQEALTTYTPEPNFTATKVTAPDNTGYKETFGTTGWQRGLTVRTDAYAAGDSNPKKWTITGWTQDDTSVGYLTNPRVAEVNVYDAEGNRRRRTTIGYTPQSEFSQPNVVDEYAADASTVLRRTKTDYINDTTYTDKGLIGLVSGRRVYDVSDGTESLQSKVTYGYDEGGDFLQNTPGGSPIRHDTPGFGTSMLVRGNMTSTRRWDLTAENDQSKSVEYKTAYNITGSPVFTRDPLHGVNNRNRQTNISYADSYSDGLNNRNTFAYPTKATDPQGFYSTVQYNFFTGATVRSQDPKGAVRGIEYDSIGRMEKVKTLVDETEYNHVRWIYSGSGTKVETYQTIKDLATETYSAQFTDGAGRIIKSMQDYPGSDGAGGQYSGQRNVYDIMGRLWKASNPAVVDAQFNLAGAEAQQGWKFSVQTYDWKGRPRITTNQDGTHKELSYEGCGCAGSEITTIKEDVNQIQNIYRTQKIYKDVLGRVEKVEDYGADGTSVYRTTKNEYNVRDQVKNLKVYQGAATGDGSCPAGTCQQTVNNYDGHGRLSGQQLPEQTGPSIVSYNKDDSTDFVTDARGAKTTYTYNDRLLVTGISYSPPSPNPTNIPSADGVTYDYDAAGHRTSMSDGMGSTIYNFNTLSQLTSEERRFNDIQDRTFTLTYEYNLAGQLKSVTDPFEARVDYNFDATGRLVDVTGTTFAGVSSYASGMQYRASGQMKHMTYGNGINLDLLYNARQMPSQYDFTSSTSGVRLMGAEYQYNDDASLKFVNDLADHRFDRSYSYDPLGLVSASYSGWRARTDVDPNDPSQNGSYQQNYTYDVFGNMTNRSGSYWYGGTSNETFTATYTNNRNTRTYNISGVGTQWSYDADGRLTRSITQNSHSVAFDHANTYDAAGRALITTGVTNFFDGDGAIVKAGSDGNYLVYSSAMGGRVITEVTAAGLKSQTHVYAERDMIATQYINSVTGGELLSWDHQRDPLGTSEHAGYGSSQKAIDPMGIATERPDYQSMNQNYQQYQNYYNGLAQYSATHYSGPATPGDFAHGCPGNALSRVPEQCGPKMNPSFASNLPNFMSDLSFAYDQYSRGVTQIFFDNYYTSHSSKGGPPTLKPMGVFQRLPGIGPGNRNPFGITGEDQLISIDGSVLSQNTLQNVPSQDLRFQFALGELLQRLKRPDCAKIFGGMKKALDTLNRIAFRFSIVDGDAQQSGKRTVMINPQGSFMAVNGRAPNSKIPNPIPKGFPLRDTSQVIMSGGDPYIKYITLGDTENAAFILFHELGHVSKIYGDNDIDDDDIIKTGKNNELIRHACFDELPAQALIIP